MVNIGPLVQHRYSEQLDTELDLHVVHVELFVGVGCDLVDHFHAVLLGPLLRLMQSWLGRLSGDFPRNPLHGLGHDEDLRGRRTSGKL